MEMLKSHERFSCMYSACMKSLDIEMCTIEQGVRKIKLSLFSKVI